MNKYFVTTPIYYVNDVPHIGHTYTTIAADVIARYYQQKGYDSKLLTGTDEHGAKIVEAAKKHNLKPQKYVDQISGEFKQIWNKLNINYARFIRTTDEDHLKSVQDFLQKMFDYQVIDPVPRLYKGLYCVGHEKFMSPEELVDGVCSDHKTKPIEYSEENYYFKLSKFQEKLEKLISSDQIKIRPLPRKNEILGKIKQGLEDISISRSNLEWGVPLPFDKKHTAYVWIDALINYYTYGKPNNLWPADLHLVGKDILWFHSVIWPAMLLSIEQLPPKEIFAHGFFTINGQKMSKTIGNVIKPDDLISKYGVDGTRYILLASFPFGEDGDFSWEYLDRLYNADLANGLGNLVARIAKLAEKNEVILENTNLKFNANISRDLEGLKFNDAIQGIRGLIAGADKTINLKRPWELHGEEAKLIIEVLAQHVREIAFHLQPFLPETSKKILTQFSGKIKSAEPLFPRLQSPGGEATEERSRI